jgi:hypothetical protein
VTAKNVIFIIRGLSSFAIATTYILMPIAGTPETLLQTAKVGFDYLNILQHLHLLLVIFLHILLCFCNMCAASHATSKLKQIG